MMKTTLAIIVFLIILANVASAQLVPQPSNSDSGYFLRTNGARGIWSPISSRYLLLDLSPNPSAVFTLFNPAGKSGFQLVKSTGQLLFEANDGYLQAYTNIGIYDFPTALKYLYFAQAAGETRIQASTGLDGIFYDTIPPVSGKFLIGSMGSGNAFTAGSIPYSNGTTLTQDNANLFWDASGARLHLGKGLDLLNNTYGYSNLTIADTSGGQDTTMFAKQWKAQRHALYAGSFSSPITTGGATEKIVRFQNIDSTVASNKADVGANSALYVINSGTVNDYGQPVGITGIAQTYSNRSYTAGNDAAGGVFYGRAWASANGVGLGMFADGRRDTARAKANAAQFSVSDWTNNTNPPYNVSGFDSTSVIWISNHGTAGRVIASGIKFGNGDAIPMAYGIGFANQNGGATTLANLVTDDTAMTSILIRGSHRTAAIAVASGAGNVGIGTITPTSALDIVGNESVSGTIFVQAAGQMATFQGSATNNAIVGINCATAGKQAYISLQDAGTAKWLLMKNTDNTFHIYDNANSRTAIKIDASSNVGIGSAAQTTINTTGIITKIGNVSTEGTFGVPAIVDTVQRVISNADVSTTNFSNSSPVGDYEVTGYVEITTAGTVVTTLTVTIGWTDDVGATTVTPINAVAATTTGRFNFTQPIHNAGANITYAASLGTPTGTPVYHLHLWCKRIN